MLPALELKITFEGIMESKRKETTIEERHIIVREFCKGKSYKIIAETVARPITTVKSIMVTNRLLGIGYAPGVHLPLIPDRNG